MKKELFFICAAAVLGTVCFTGLTAGKVSAKTSGDYQYVVTGKKEKTCAIRRYLGHESDVVVPARIDGYVVTRIGNRAFKNNTDIQSIKLSKYITVIGESSFYGCSGLKNVSLPAKLHTVRKKAFCYCDRLKSISLPAGLKKIGKESFYGCPFDEIDIPQNVQSIGLDAFRADIGKVSVDPKNRTFDSRDNSNSVIETASDTLIFAGKDPVIPASVKRIGEFAFWNHDEISSIDIPGSVEDIGDGAFSDCNKLKEITVPSSVKTIGENAFFGCDKLGKISFSEGLVSIGRCVFEGCDSLKEIRLPDSLETIGAGAFFCNNLDSIYIPESLKKTDLKKIFEFSSATKISVAEGNPYYDSRDNCNAVIETASNTLIRASKTTVIPDSVTAIGDDAFSSLHDLKEITVPSNVKTIGNSAFWNCELLEKVILPEGLVSIGDEAFEGCSSLREIGLPDSLERIGEEAFFACNKLEKIRIPKNLKKTDLAEVFVCESLKSISVADGNPYYDSRNNCNAVVETASDTIVLACRKTRIPDTVKVIGANSFRSAPSKIVIPEGVVKIADSAFDGRENLERITLPSTLRYIGEEAFYGCSLKTVNYRGSKALWNKIKIEDKDSLSGVKINFNYKG